MAIYNRRFRFLRLLFVAAAVGLAAVSCVSADDAGFVGSSSRWTAVSASGPVTAREPMDDENAWSRVRRGDQLQPLSQVRTGRRGKATLVLEEHILLVRPESELTLPHLENLNVDTQVLQDTGRVTYEVDGSKVDRFEVVTPYLIAGVKGTVFTVAVRNDGARVSVEEGVVEVWSRLSDDHVEVQAGQEARLRTGDVRQELEVREADPVRSEQLRLELRMAKRRANLVSSLRTEPTDLEQDGLAAFAWTDDLGFVDHRDRWRLQTSESRSIRLGESSVTEDPLADQEDVRFLALEESITTMLEDSRASVDRNQAN